MDKNIKIALVGPGLMPIPPVGWGAIEILIWKYYNELISLGYDVTIYNSDNLKEVSNAINKNSYDFVHVHYDQYVRFFSQNLKVPFCITSHYGLILQRKQWSTGYFSIFSDFLSAPGIIALSPEIKQLYLDSGYKGPIYILKNGINVNEFSFSKSGNGRIICLGKIEPRKRQAELAEITREKIDIDFIGPIDDHNFKEGGKSKYLGTWKKEEVQNKLTEYSVLVLLSKGEAAPMVVVEALAAGLCVVISKSSSANLSPNPFIITLEDHESNPDVIIEALNKAMSINFEKRETIREYALNNFDSKIIMKNYLNIINDFVNKKSSIKMPMPRINSYILKNFYKYIYSRLWFDMSNIKLLRLIYKRTRKM